MSVFYQPYAQVMLLPDSSKFKIKGEAQGKNENRSAEFNNS